MIIFSHSPSKSIIHHYYSKFTKKCYPENGSSRLSPNKLSGGTTEIPLAEDFFLEDLEDDVGVE